MAGLATIILCMMFSPAHAKEKQVKKQGAPDNANSTVVAKDEPAKQSGFIFVKFRKNVSDAAIQEVADHYEAKVSSPLNSVEASTHEQPERWRKFWFESVESLIVLADRIDQDMRVVTIELQVPAR